MTQTARVLDFMRCNGSISTMQAFTQLGIVSLPRRILDLKRAGYGIRAERSKVKNRYGEPTHYNLYFLTEGKNND